MTRLLNTCIFITALFVLCSCDTPMSEYVPANDDEKEIVGILDRFLEARNGNDVQKLAALFQESGEYIAGDGTALKGRDAIAHSDPVWWTQYGKQKLLNLELPIDKSTAAVSTTGRWGVRHRYPQIYTLVKEDGSWLITKVVIDR